MKKLLILTVIYSFLFLHSTIFAFPSVYPTGTTIYKPGKCWSGYTILSKAGPNATLIDMNGNEVKQWEGYDTQPNRILPGGFLISSMTKGKGASNTMVQVDWNDNIVWQFNKFEQVSTAPPGGKDGPPEEKAWSARQHHDWQREGSPVGYYTPGMEPMVKGGNTLILGHTASRNPKINKNELEDDIIYEVTWDGEIVWKWVASEHVDEMGFSEVEFQAMQRMRQPKVDWFHINCASWLGPNKWYDAGDERFHPDNIIFDSRHANILGIIDKKTGKIVWQVGPRYDASPELKKLGWIIGVHHTHMIPKGLPGAGNIMCYDNGGGAGYGPPDPVGGPWSFNRAYSRVLEFNPVTLEKVWEYSPEVLGWFMLGDSMREFSPYISGAQRFPNGNTLITEGAMGRLIEVTPDLEIVWEYISPFYSIEGKTKLPSQSVYRAYRVPYEWVPQLKKPKELAVIPPGNQNFKVQGTEDGYKGYVKKQ